MLTAEGFCPDTRKP